MFKVCVVREEKLWVVLVVIKGHIGMMGLHLVLVLRNSWDYLENEIFDRWKHNFLEG